VSAIKRGVVNVSHHLVLLVEDGYHPGAPLPPTVTGLVEGGRDRVVVHTGIHTGVVSVMVETLDVPPPRVDLDWEEVAEVTLHASQGRVRIGTALGTGVPDALSEVLTPGGPGDYRVRVHARGRDTDIDGSAFTPFEEYAIQLWPAPPAADTVYKATDRYGAELRLLAERAQRLGQTE
jgi:hypothetical protein